MIYLFTMRNKKKGKKLFNSSKKKRNLNIRGIASCMMRTAEKHIFVYCQQHICSWANRTNNSFSENRDKPHIHCAASGHENREYNWLQHLVTLITGTRHVCCYNFFLLDTVYRRLWTILWCVWIIHIVKVFHKLECNTIPPFNNLIHLLLVRYLMVQLT